MFYDITTAGQLAALNHILKAIDIRLGYLAADGVTQTPMPGRSAWMVAGIMPEVSLPLGETTTWTELRVHPTISGRYALLVDQYVVYAVNHEIAALQAIGSPTAGQTALLNALLSLPDPVSLDNSWSVGA